MLRNVMKSLSSPPFFLTKMQLCSATNSGKLTGKVAVITASTEGIGFAIAQRLARDGASVVVSSRHQGHVTRAVGQLEGQGLQVSGVVCHVAKAEDRKRLFEEALSKYGGIDILISNAAANPTMGPVLDCEEQAWDKIFEVNVKAAYLLSREVLPHLLQRGGGSIVYVSSIAAYSPLPLLGAYNVSKTALLGLAKNVAQDLASDNIRVNCLCPGVVKTKFSSALTENEGANEAMLAMIPMRRTGNPDEMGGIVSFLCSDDASYITGENIVAAGGMMSRL